MSYAWIIDRDILHEIYGDGSKAGTTGPRDAPDWMVAAFLANPAGTAWPDYRFELYDDDGEIYYTGRMITDEGRTEAACYGPLGDFGAPDSGCTSVIYPDHPDMSCS